MVSSGLHRGQLLLHREHVPWLQVKAPKTRPVNSQMPAPESKQYWALLVVDGSSHMHLSKQRKLQMLAMTVLGEGRRGGCASEATS